MPAPIPTIPPPVENVPSGIHGRIPICLIAASKSMLLIAAECELTTMAQMIGASGLRSAPDPPETSLRVGHPCPERMPMRRIANERAIVRIGLVAVATAFRASTFGQGFVGDRSDPIPDIGSADDPDAPDRVEHHRAGSIRVGGRSRDAPRQPASDRHHGDCRADLRQRIGSKAAFKRSALFALVCLPAFGVCNSLPVGLFAVAVPGAVVLLFDRPLGMPLSTSRFNCLF